MTQPSEQKDLRAIALLDQLNAIDAQMDSLELGSKHRLITQLISVGLGTMFWMLTPQYRWAVAIYVVGMLSFEPLLRIRKRRKLAEDRDRLLAQHARIAELAEHPHSPTAPD